MLSLANPPAKVSADVVAAGLRAFFRIVETWKLKPEHAIVLLGQPSRSTYYQWKRGTVGSAAASIDLATRISHVLGIFKALETLYPHPELADRWVR